MAVGTPQQQRPAACAPVREEQTSLPSVSHQNTAHLHAQPTISSPTVEGVWLTRSPKGKIQLEFTG